MDRNSTSNDELLVIELDVSVEHFLQAAMPHANAVRSQASVLQEQAGSGSGSESQLGDGESTGGRELKARASEFVLEVGSGEGRVVGHATV